MKEDQDIQAQGSREQLFIQTYMTLTGVSESGARAVFMYVGYKESILAEDTPGLASDGIEANPANLQRGAAR